MTKDYSKERFVPKQLTTKIKENEYVDFIWNNDKEKPSCIAYPKKGKNKIWWYRFKNVEHMNNRIDALLSSYQERKKRNEEYKSERLQPHTLKTGDIMVASWGYDQTNIDFYKVVKLVGKTSVELCAMSNEYLKSDSRTSDKVIPGKIKENAEPFLKRVNGKYNSINISSFEYARKWDGSAKYQTALGYGH